MGMAEAEAHLKNMIERGHMYLYLESVLGRGITIVLGTAFAETTWTTLLTKGSQGPDPIMKMLKRSSAAVLGENFVTLRDGVVHHKMTEVMELAASSTYAQSLDEIYLAPPASIGFAVDDLDFPSGNVNTA